MRGWLDVFWTFTKIGFQNESAYRANFWVEIVESLVNVGSALGSVQVVFARTDTLVGWTPAELVTLLGVYFTVYGLIHVVISPSLTRFMDDVRQGNLDFTLTKPADAQLLVSASEVRVWKLVDLLLGLAILCWGLFGIGARVSLLAAAGFALALVAGATTVYAFWMLLATCAFWFIRLENILMLFWNMYQAGRWPVGIYPRWLRIGLTALVPVAFAVTVPAEALAGRLTVSNLALACAVSLTLVVVSRWFWLRGLKRYSGASA
ncbi:MAG TPA: ABC-2 family transporter protein [Myxococcota bacterium]|nr:ABC-2 family transporter protein [Myxococcota bacterium]